MNGMVTKHILWSWTALAVLACGDDDPPIDPPVPAAVEEFAGNGQTAAPGAQLSAPLTVLVTDDNGDPAAGVVVSWSVVSGGGSISPTSSTSNAAGQASAQFTLGPGEGEQQAQAAVTGLDGSPVVFTATASLDPTPNPTVLTIAGGGNNVPERYSSDLWVHGSFAYTGTWGGFPRKSNAGDVLKVWSLGASGAPALVDSIKIPGISTVSDVQVSEDGQLLMLTAEYDPSGGLYLYSLADPANPVFLDREIAAGGLHTATLADIDGARYAFGARNSGPEGPALVIYNVTDPSDISVSATVPIPPFYGIHDTFVRDGLAFVFAWDSGVIIYDVGDGRSGGSPTSPVEVSRLITSATGATSPAVHNGWWFHNPVTGEKRYLFIGQEGPSVIGSEASGDIHVVDVSDLDNPSEVAFFHLDGAGAHNFWMDEARQILYAAFYDGGVVALDVSGELRGDLSDRLLSQILPGGAGNTFTWGVQLANGSLYAIDMVSGLWQLKTE